MVQSWRICPSIKKSLAPNSITSHATQNMRTNVGVSSQFPFHLPLALFASSPACALVITNR